MSAVLHSAPRFASHDGYRDTLTAAIGGALYHVREENGELIFGIERERVEDVLRLLRDEHEYQQLMEIAGVDYPQRDERFEVVYILLSLTRNHRIMVKCRAAEDTPVPTVTTLWPNAGWLEREVFDMYGVLFDGNTDLRRILTDYGFEGHPFRKDFPLTGYQEVRYSEEAKRVVYEPVELPQDFRTFEFTSPWEGANYPLPGDEKATMPPVKEVKVTEKPIETGAGPATDAKAPRHVAPAATDGTIAGQGHGDPAPVKTDIPAPGAPKPTEDSPGQPARQVGAPETPGATTPDQRDSRSDTQSDRRDHDRNENS